MTCAGLVRPSAPVIGPSASNGSESENTLPRRTSCAAAATFSEVTRLKVPISSSAPHLPQFRYWAHISRILASEYFGVLVPASCVISAPSKLPLFATVGDGLVTTVSAKRPPGGRQVQLF